MRAPRHSARRRRWRTTREAAVRRRTIATTHRQSKRELELVLRTVQIVPDSKPSPPRVATTHSSGTLPLRGRRAAGRSVSGGRGGGRRCRCRRLVAPGSAAGTTAGSTTVDAAPAGALVRSRADVDASAGQRLLQRPRAERVGVGTIVEDAGAPAARHVAAATSQPAARPSRGHWPGGSSSPASRHPRASAHRLDTEVHPWPDRPDPRAALLQRPGRIRRRPCGGLVQQSPPWHPPPGPVAPGWGWSMAAEDPASGCLTVL